MFRSPQLPPDVPGRLFLHSMPGKEEPFADACAAIAANDVVRVVSLTPLDEVAEKSPKYALAIEAGTPWVQVIYPIADFGVPDNEESFKQTVDDIATALR